MKNYSRGKNIAINIIFLIISLLFFLFIAEIIIRYIFPQTSDHFQFDPIIGRRYKPGLFEPITAGVVHKKYINRQGFSDREWAIKKPEGTRRIVILGDSFTQALGVDDEKDFQSLLEKKLREKKNNNKIEVFNFGIIGQGTTQEYLTLKNYALKYSPDIIIVASFFYNDIWNNSQQLSLIHAPDDKARPFLVVKDGKDILIPPQYPDAGPLYGFMKEHFHLFRLIVRKYIGVRSNIVQIIAKYTNDGMTLLTKYNPELLDIDIYKPTEQRKPEWLDAWNLTELIFGHIQKISNEANAKLIVVLIPCGYEIYQDEWQKALSRNAIEQYDKDRKASRYNLNWPRERALQMLNKKSISAVDLTPYFKKRAAIGEKLYIPVDGHLNEYGHEVVAEVLLNNIDWEKLLGL